MFINDVRGNPNWYMHHKVPNKKPKFINFGPFVSYFMDTLYIKSCPLGTT